MNTTPCEKRLSGDELVKYWLGELTDAEQAGIEEHLFKCSSCSDALEELVSLAGGIRELAKTGDVPGIVSPSYVERLKSSGLRIREYRLKPGETVFCTIAPGDALAVAHLEARLEDATRLDVVLDTGDGARPPVRFSDVAFDPGAGEVVLAPRAYELRQLGKVVQRVRLISVTPSGEQQLGEYVFSHSPYRED